MAAGRCFLGIFNKHMRAWKKRAGLLSRARHQLPEIKNTNPIYIRMTEKLVLSVMGWREGDGSALAAEVEEEQV